jgi:hypothetical protein
LLIPLQHIDATQTFAGDAPSTATPTLLAAERCHPALRVAALVAPHAAHRSGKRPCHLVLLGKARLHQKHHRIGLGDRILGPIVMHRQSGDDDHALIRFNSQATTRIDRHGSRRRR